MPTRRTSDRPRCSCRSSSKRPRSAIYPVRMALGATDERTERRARSDRRDGCPIGDRQGRGITPGCGHTERQPQLPPFARRFGAHVPGLAKNRLSGRPIGLVLPPFRRADGLSALGDRASEPRAYGCSMAIDVHPATADRWDDLVAVFGRRGQDPSWCWCQLFLRSAAEDTSAPAVLPDNRTALHKEIASASVPPGLIAYVDDQPAGWTRIQPRASLPGLRGNKALARVLSEDPVGIWWITCFAVDSRHRRMGVGSALLRCAVDFAHTHGATAVEGHPVDVAGLRAERVSGSSLYTGTKAMFAAAGFVEVARTAPTRPVMRLSLRGRLPL